MSLARTQPALIVSPTGLAWLGLWSYLIIWGRCYMCQNSRPSSMKLIDELKLKANIAILGELWSNEKFLSLNMVQWSSTKLKIYIKLNLSLIKHKHSKVLVGLFTPSRGGAPEPILVKMWIQGTHCLLWGKCTAHVFLIPISSQKTPWRLN